MKANELMIGDWVYAIDDNGEKHPCRVNDLKYDYINKCDDFCVDFYGTKYNPEWPDVTFNVEPIPLTSEILEKNGFHYTNNHTLKGADTYIFRLEQHGFDFTITIKLNDYFALDSYDDRVYRLAQIETGRWCVHHLQHALRLCGIDKEITL